jgi:amino acid transporter
MNKRVNTVLFLVGATAFNLLVMFLLIVVCLVVITAIFKDSLNPNLLSVLMIVIFIGSIAASFFIYGKVIKLLSRKYDLDKYLLPLFRRKRK